MDSRFLESLIRVVETGSIAQAARIQHLTAAAISQRIRTLEIELDTELLTRTGYCAKPTEACVRILERARRIVKEVDHLVEDLRPGSYTYPLRIGVIPSQWSPTLPIELDALRDNCPKTRISLSLNTSRTLYNALLKGELDAIVIEAPDFAVPRNIRSALIRREALVLISKEEVCTDLKNVLTTNKFIEYLPDPFVTNIVAKCLEDLDLSLTPICDTGSLESIRSLVCQGAGVSLVPKWPGLEIESDQLVVTELKNADYARDIVLLVSEGNEQKDFFDRLLSILKRHRD